MTISPFEVPEIESLAGLLPAFRFEHLIAQGGMGVVYKARQLSLDRDVAIKILPREFGRDPFFRSSFEAEAKAMARLSHKNLIKVFDFGDVDGLLYIVMEYVPGKSLHHSAHGKAIDPKQAVEIIIAACAGISHAHGNGIVHRDIKPGNILLTPDREPKIGNFGLSRCTFVDADGLAMGSPGYMAPEIISHPESGSTQADVFAIGVVLRELLTGIPPEREGSEKAVVPDLKLAAICRKATHADPSLRHADVSTLADQLTRWMSVKPAGAAAPSWKPSTNTPKRPTVVKAAPSANRSILKNCATIAVLLGAIHLLWGVYQTKQADIVRQQQEQDAKPAIVKIIQVERTAFTSQKPSQALASTDPESTFVNTFAEGNLE